MVWLSMYGFHTNNYFKGDNMNRLKETLINCVTGEENIQAIKDVFTYFEKNDSGLSIDIEDYDGNSIGGVRVNGIIFNHKTLEQGELSVADWDGDYIWDDDSSDLIRIQLDGTLKSRDELIQEEWNNLQTGNYINSNTELFENEQDLIVVKRYETKPYAMDKQEILHMLINNEVKDFNQLANNCIKIFFNGDVEYLICPIYADKEKKQWFKEIKNLLG